MHPSAATSRYLSSGKLAKSPFSAICRASFAAQPKPRPSGSRLVSQSHSSPSRPLATSASRYVTPKVSSIPVWKAQFHAADQPRPELAPPTTDEEASQFLEALLPSLQFPPKLVSLTITHPSWKAGVEGHNNRLSFIGRRVLNSYLVLFLHAARLKDNASQTSAGTPSQFNTAASEVDYKGIVDFILDSKQLGSNVGAAWNVDKVMRWVSAAPKNAGSAANGIGRDAVRAITVEAIMGSVFHQYGASVAHRVFQTRILPHLKSLLHPSIQGYVDEVSAELGGLDAALLGSSEPLSSFSDMGVRETTSNGGDLPLRRAASA